MFSSHPFFTRTLRVFLWAGVSSSLTTLAQTPPVEEVPGWQISATVSEESIGQGLPVLALEHDDWPSHLPNPIRDGRATRSLNAQLLATHPSGWRLAAIARAQAWMDANADAIAVAALEAQGLAPSTPRQFQVNASSQSWSGNGILLGTPWWPISAAGQWQWQADLALLNLTQLRLADASGIVHYRGAGTYDFDLRSQRSNTDITGRFLPASGNVGYGASLSIAMQGELLPQWHIGLRVDDLASVLHWEDLATDANTLNSTVANRRPDGFLDYGPMLKGQKSLPLITSQIAPHWQLTAAHSLITNAPSPELTLQMSRQAGINQAWLGWRSGPASGNLPHWSLALEPHWPALKLEGTWCGWQLVLASDGKGSDTQFRRVELSWQSRF